MFDLNRRKFLISSLIIGASVSTTELAFAEDRYQVLVGLQQDAIQATKVYNELRDGRLVVYQSREQFMLMEASGVDKRMTGLCDYLHREFNRSDVRDPNVRSSVRSFFRDPKQLNVLSADELRTVEDAVVTIAVLRNMLATHRAPITHEQLDRFASTHSALIVDNPPTV